MIDRGLLNFLHNPPPGADDFEIPRNITGTAGMQLLVYNPFDEASPTLHQQFYAELNALNGDGYPHQTVENVGVSFGTPAPNPETGQHWLVIDSNFLSARYFSINHGSEEAQPGSLLPREITNIAGFTPVFRVFRASYELDRRAQPTFIPYDSALDIVSGTSRFDVTFEAENASFHNVVPGNIVEPLLAQLGYSPPPLTASISGPSFVTEDELETWTADADGGTPPYSYDWSWRYVCTGGGGPAAASPDGDWATTNGPTEPCDTDPRDGGTNRLLSFSPPDHGTLRITLTVEDDAGEVELGLKTVEVAYSGQGGAAVGPQAAALTAAPAEFALGAPRPNPSEGTARVRYALPERADVEITVYNTLGREVKRLVDGYARAGRHTARFDGSDLPSGVYLVRMEAEGATGTHAETERVTLVR